jgi:hypothetical protein
VPPSPSAAAVIIARVDLRADPLLPEAIRPIEAVAILAGRQVAADSTEYTRLIKRLRTAMRYGKVATSPDGRYVASSVARLRDDCARRGITLDAGRLRFASLVRSWKAREAGCIRLSDAAVQLGLDQRSLRRLYEEDHIEGQRVPARGRHDELWLERASLAAYCWSRPREQGPRSTIGRATPDSPSTAATGTRSWR